MDNRKCPLCGCEEIAMGKQSGHGSMMAVDKFSTGSDIIAEICTNCGYILSMRVEKPEKFKPAKQIRC